MTEQENISAALEWIREASEAMLTCGDKAQGANLKALAADYERRGDEIARLKPFEDEYATNEREIERLRAENESLKARIIEHGKLLNNAAVDLLEAERPELIGRLWRL